MSKIFILIAMLFCHVIDDYKIQSPVLNNLKQKEWWKENAPESKYKYDYIMGLIMHSISWSFMIMLPIAIYYKFNVSMSFFCTFIGNACLHGVIDDLKANHKVINLVADQLIHIAQIIYTFFLFVIL